VASAGLRYRIALFMPHLYHLHFFGRLFHLHYFSLTTFHFLCDRIIDGDIVAGGDIMYKNGGQKM
jgi:hypothetical protein